MKGCNSILLVEDDRDIMSALIEALRSEGYRPEQARDGIEALKKIERLSKPCLVLLDLLMPGMDGFTFISEIKQREMTGVVHIVVITAMSRVNLEGIRVLAKPMDLDALFHVVDDVCGDIKNAPA